LVEDLDEDLFPIDGDSEILNEKDFAKLSRELPKRLVSLYCIVRINLVIRPKKLIRDTRRRDFPWSMGHPDQRSVTKQSFLLFETPFLMLWEDKATKDTLFHILLTVQSN
jgi:hypothetical protein